MVEVKNLSSTPEASEVRVVQIPFSVGWAFGSGGLGYSPKHLNPVQSIKPQKLSRTPCSNPVQPRNLKPPSFRTCRGALAKLGAC